MRFFRLLATGVVLLVLVGSILGMACAGAQGEQGPKGDPGADGVGIESVVDNGDGTLTIGLTDGSTYTTDMVTGPQGEKGEPGMPGVGIVWEGEWSNSTAYSANDAVGYQGSSYISKQDGNTNHVPTDTAWWDLWLAKGAAGETGPQGPQGLQGESGDTGPQGIQGEPGPNMIVAMGTVGPTGAILVGHNVGSVTWNPGTLRYEITLSGRSYDYSEYVTVVTPGADLIGRYGSVLGMLVVYIYDFLGNKIQGTFSFMVLQPS